MPFLPTVRKYTNTALVYVGNQLKNSQYAVTHDASIPSTKIQVKAPMGITLDIILERDPAASSPTQSTILKHLQISLSKTVVYSYNR